MLGFEDMMMMAGGYLNDQELKIRDMVRDMPYCYSCKDIDYEMARRGIDYDMLPDYLKDMIDEIDIRQ